MMVRIATSQKLNQPRYGLHLASPMAGVVRARAAHLKDCRMQSAVELVLDFSGRVGWIICLPVFSNYGRAISHWTEIGGWDYRSWRVSPHRHVDDASKRRNSNHTRPVIDSPGRRIWRQSQWHYLALHECNWWSKALETHRVVRWKRFQASNCPCRSWWLGLTTRLVSNGESLSISVVEHKACIANYTGQVCHLSDLWRYRTEVMILRCHVRVFDWEYPDAKKMGLITDCLNTHFNPNL